MTAIDRRDILKGSLAAAAAGSLSGCSLQAESENPSISFTTALTERFNIRHPFVCAGMAFVCDTPDLAVAVGQAGGMGALAGSLLAPDVLRERIRSIRAATDAPFHVNLLSVFPFDAQLQVAIEEQVAAVSFHFGLPSEAVVRELQAAGVECWVQIGDVASAREADAIGVDTIIAQGNEAGGHMYAGIPVGSLVPAIRDSIGEHTILAAGGIADGRSALAALASGADGVWVGTRLVATPEANAHPAYKRAIVDAKHEDTVITAIYGPEAPAFNPMRVIANPLIEEWNDRLSEVPVDRSSMDVIGETLFAGEMIPVRPFDSFVPVPETSGDLAQMPFLAGQGTGLIESIEPAAQVVETMMEEAAQLRAAL